MASESDPVDVSGGNPPNEPHFHDAARYLPRTMIAASILVMLALIGLAIAPAVMLFRGKKAGKFEEEAIQQGTRHIAQLSKAMYKETAEFRGYMLTGEPHMLRNAIESQTDQLQILQDMDTCMLTLGPATVQGLVELRRTMAHWHEIPDSVAAGLMTRGEYQNRMTEQASRRDSAFSALDALEREIDRLAVENLNEKRVYAGQLRVLSIVLGVIAVISAGVVGWFLLRLRAVAIGLETAAEQEAHLRHVAETRREQLERVTDSRERLMRGFTHDVKNPLGAADGYLQLMQQGMTGPLSEPQQFKIIKVRGSIHDALTLIDDLLELARTEQGEIDFHHVHVDLRLLVDEACADYHDLAESKGLHLTVELAPRPVMVQTDPSRVRQILGNLISNAIKYTDQGGVEVKVTVRERVNRGTHAVVEVSDTGRGIPPDRYEDIFQEFTRLGPGDVHGAGVGLAISRRLARGLNGDIIVRSTIGQGSSFMLVLPLTPRGKPLQAT